MIASSIIASKVRSTKVRYLNSKFEICKVRNRNLFQSSKYQKFDTVRNLFELFEFIYSTTTACYTHPI